MTPGVLHSIVPNTVDVAECMKTLEDVWCLNLRYGRIQDNQVCYGGIEVDGNCIPVIQILQ